MSSSLEPIIQYTSANIQIANARPKGYVISGFFLVLALHTYWGLTA